MCGESWALLGSVLWPEVEGYFLFPTHCLCHDGVWAPWYPSQDPVSGLRLGLVWAPRSWGGGGRPALTWRAPPRKPESMEGLAPSGLILAEALPEEESALS